VRPLDRKVFFDESGLRGQALSTLETATIVFISLTFSILLINFSISPSLSTMITAKDEALAALPSAKRTASDQQSRKIRHRTFDQTAKDVQRMAFLSDWDVNSFISLKENAAHLDVLLPFWLHLESNDGTITQNNVALERKIREWLFENAPHLRIMPVLDNYEPSSQEWDADIISSILFSVEAQLKLISIIEDYVKLHRVHGIVLDFKDISKLDCHRLIPFAEKLNRRLHESGYELYIVIPVTSDIFDVKALAEVVDRIILLNYYEHSEPERPGPLASQTWFEEQLDRFFENVDDEKFIVAIGNYAFDWGEHKSEEISIFEAWRLLKKSKGDIEFGEYLNPTFRYKNSRGELHEVWFLDAITAFNQSAAALAMKPGGLALYRLGSEDPSVWTLFARGHLPDAGVVKELSQVDAGNLITYNGDGEILRVTALNTAGNRKLEYQPQYNLITEQQIIAIPTPTTISRLGLPANDGKVVALTFDDGPSEDFTDKILDILADKNVRATFFVVGSNVAFLPNALKRMYAEGHDIGNHTFTHPNISLLSKGQLNLELTATERSIEAILGIRSNLFRPPFAEDIEPETVEQAHSLIRSADLGYITVGQGVDPLDWSLPGTDAIVKATIQQLAKGEGNIVLLHDGGGNRDQTVEALPQIIEELKERDYNFVTIHELLGVARVELMPPVAPDNSMAQAFTLIGLGVSRVVSWLIKCLFIAGIVLGVLRAILVTAGALTHAARRKNLINRRVSSPKFAVIIPAYNEASVICKSVWNLLKLRHRNFEIVIVDDGSTDGTADAVRSEFSENPRVRILTQTNGGKSSALSLGLEQTDTEVIVTQDADTIFDEKALSKLLRHFKDRRVGAVAGAAEVGNQINWLTKFQSIEYITCQNMDRRALELVNAITVVPGAIGAWRRSALRAAGGFTGDTLAEDTDITLRIERAGWSVVCDNGAIGRTEAPENIRAFCKQRFRWMFGTLQASAKHVLELRHGAGWGMKCVGLPYLLLFQFGFTLMAPLIDLVLVWNIIATVWTHHMHPAMPSPIWNVLPYWLAFQTIEAGMLALAFRLDKRQEWWRALPLLLAQRFYYRQILYWIAGRCLIAALHGRIVGWNKLMRTGRVASIKPQLAHQI